MENIFSQDEWSLTLELLGAHNVSPYKGGFRSGCPIHHGDNDKAFAVWLSDSGEFRASCHSHACVKAASLEWVVAKSRNVQIREAVEWLAYQITRPLLVPDGKAHGFQLVPGIAENISYCDEEALTRLVATYPYHAYWKDRGYTPEIVREYQLTYRGIDKRMVIPIKDENAGFVGMVTRATESDDPLKYKWESPNTNKAHWLFGMPQALKRHLTVRGRRAVFLVEGTLDVLHAAELGYPAVSSQGNRLSMDQVKQLIGNWDLVIIVPDNDEPGQNLIKDARKLAGPFLELAVVVLTKGIKDLDEMPVNRLSSFLNSTIQNWSEIWQAAPRRNRNFLTLNPSASAA